MNAAEETAFDAFVAEKIGFLDMANIVEAVMDRLIDCGAAASIADVFAADGEARKVAADIIATHEKTA